ncbi:MAG: polyketide cyclase, partial [Mycobacterium sp.]
PEPVVGEAFTTAATRRLGRILAVEAPAHLTGEIMGVCVSYVLLPEDQTTRLLMKAVTAMSRWATPWLSVGDLVMARRQLLNLKRLAERSAAVAQPPSS